MSFEGYNLNVNKVEALKFQITIEVEKKKTTNKSKEFWTFWATNLGGGEMTFIEINLIYVGMVKNNYNIYGLMFIKGVNYHVGHEKKHKNINSQTQEYKYSSIYYLH
jgi:hypothetical protein